MIERDRPVRSRVPRPLPRIAAGVVQVRVDVVGRALAGAGQQRPGVGEDQRVVVDVDDPGVGGDPLGDLVGVVRGGQAGADVEELPDAGLAGQVAHGAAEEGPRVARATSTMPGNMLADVVADLRGRRRSCPCRRASSSTSGRCARRARLGHVPWGIAALAHLGALSTRRLRPGAVG